MIISEEKFLSAKVSDISQVYSGKRDCCRCGCGGTYIATTYMANPRSDVDNTKVEKLLNKAKKMIANGADVDFAGTYVDVEVGKDRSLTFYFDEIRQDVGVHESHCKGTTCKYGDPTCPVVERNRLVPLTYQEFSNKINREAYTSKLEYKSFREDAVKNKAYKEDDKHLYDEFKKDLRRHLDTELETRLTDNQFKVVFNKVWEEGHSSGYSEVLNYTVDIIYLLKEFVGIKVEEEGEE